MDELELLKKDWKRKEQSLPKLSYDEIYKMIWKKSSSLVKWIFIISILEFVFWLGISFFFKDAESVQKFDSFDTKHLMLGLTIIGYLVAIYFFYRFYTNYRKVNATDNSKTLMENILRTRRTVKEYVMVNLVMIFISLFIALYVQMNNDPTVIKILDTAAADGSIFAAYATYIGLTLLAFAVLVGVLLLFYYLIYGLLLRRLNGNYKELKKLEN